MQRWKSLTVCGLVMVGIGTAGLSQATGQQAQKGANTPSSWSYDIKDGKRVPRAERKVNADGSWTEETRSGKCVTTRTGRDGEVRVTRKCD